MKITTSVGGGEGENVVIVDLRKQAINSFVKLLELGMYMRGWKVSQNTENEPFPFPLSSSDSIVEPERQPEVDLNVTIAIREYEESLDAITDSELRRLVRSAPLLRLISRGGTPSSPLPHFGATVNIEQGLTVEDRIGIVS